MLTINQAVNTALQTRSNIELTPSIAQKLLPSENVIVEAAVVTVKNPKIQDIDFDGILDLAEQIRKLAIIRLGLNTDRTNEEEESVLISELAKAIYKFQQLTVKEIRMAVDKALSGDYLMNGQHAVFFTITNFTIWVKTYIEETKKPVMKKHAQLLHQQERPVEVPSVEEQKRQAAELINTYLDMRKRNPEHRAEGVAVLYVLAEGFGIIKSTPSEKEELWTRVQMAHPRESKEWKVDRARTLAYNAFISSLLENGWRLDEKGCVIDDEELIAS